MKNSNLAGILGGIAAIITAVGGIYGIYIKQQNKTDEVDNNVAKEPKTEYRCSVEGRKLRIDENWSTSPGWKVTYPGRDPDCKFDITDPDYTTYCVNDDNEVLVPDEMGVDLVGHCTQL